MSCGRVYKLDKAVFGRSGHCRGSHEAALKSLSMAPLNGRIKEIAARPAVSAVVFSGRRAGGAWRLHTTRRSMKNSSSWSGSPAVHDAGCAGLKRRSLQPILAAELISSRSCSPTGARLQPGCFAISTPSQSMQDKEPKLFAPEPSVIRLVGHLTIARDA
jgi:hypothetical protein